MSSTTPPGAGPVTVPQLRDAVAQYEAAAAFIADALSAGGGLDLGSVPADVAADVAVALLRAADRGVAAATVVTGHVTAITGPGTGTLIGGTYASPRRWLEVETGLSPHSAKAVLARARDLREHSARVREAWLAEDASGDMVREMTCGVSGMLATLPTTRDRKAALRAEALEVLMPVAKAGTVADVKKVVARLRMLAQSAVAEDADDEAERARLAAQAAMEAYDDQSLTCVKVGDLVKLEAWLLPEPAAAAMTVLDQYSRRIADREPDVVHDPDCPLASPAPPPLTADATSFQATRWCTCGGCAAAGVVSKDRWPHLLAVGFGELMTGLLDNASVGSHHGIAPHVTVQVSLEDLRAGLGGELVMPGSDENVLLTSEAVRRIMCDAAITPVVVQRLLALEAATGTDHLAQLLLSTAVAVLYVGRDKRTVTPAQRRALEARDRHCVFPGCRAHPRRCQAHHVREWEHDGPTDLDNLALLCRRHHTSVHEGGWTITPTPGIAAHETGCWTLAPPRTQP